MELHQLEYAVAIAKHQNFTRAAEEISLSQPSLSQQINKLEEEVGVKLFDRNTRKVVLTSAGQTFIKHAKRVLSEMEQLHNSMQKHVGLLKGKFIIGVTPVVGTLKLSSLITAFQKAHPGLTIQIVEGESCVLFEQLCTAKIDAAMLTLPATQDTSAIDFYTLIEDETVLVVPADHPLATKSIIDLAAAAEEKFIFPSTTTGAYSIMIKACQAAGFAPQKACACSQVETIMDLIRSKVGIALLSSRIAAAHSDEEITLVRLTNAPSKPTVLAILKRSQQNPIARAFCELSLKTPTPTAATVDLPK